MYHVSCGGKHGLDRFNLRMYDAICYAIDMSKICACVDIIHVQTGEVVSAWVGRQRVI